jgi:ribonuclease D
MQVVGRADQLEAPLRQALRADRLALDLEASGMFAYRARICVAQLAWADEVVLVDTLTVPVPALRQLLGLEGPVKIVHDVGFDARLLAEEGVDLGNVHDTALAARMLGRTSTGLASLLESELGVRIGKELQQHDWRLRPLDERMLAYLASDVIHLEALERRLWGEVVERGIEQEVLEETRYRLASSIHAARTPRSDPAYLRVKGVDRLPEREKAVLLVVAELREREAERRDVPPYKVAGNETLLAIARSRPATPGEVAKIRGVGTSTPAARRFVESMATAIAGATERLPDEERERFDRPRAPGPDARARRGREARLTAWRREEAKRRGVDEQVVLPGHCMKEAVEADVTDIEQLARVPGIGAFRVERDGAAILLALRGPEAAP